MTIRHKKGRVIVAQPLRKRTSPRCPIVVQTSSSVTPPAIARASISYGLALASVYATTGPELSNAKRVRRDTKCRLTKLVGVDAVAHFTACLELDGGLLLTALSHAPEGIRQYTLQGALNGAQTALEHGVVSRAALVMLSRSYVWQSLCSAYQHASLKAGGDDAFDRRASLAGQQARLDLLGALELAKSPILSQVREPEVDADALVREATEYATKQMIAAGFMPDDTSET